MKLNPSQQQAVEYIEGPLLVLAGAGSGKTRVITNKIAYLIEQKGYHASSIVAVTFTNKAAREMKERAAQTLRGTDASGLNVCTFHNLGLNMIRKEVKKLGFKAGFSIFDAQDCLDLLKELLNAELSLSKDELQQIQGHISNWKNNLITPEQAIQQATGHKEHLAAQGYLAYQKQLKAYNAVDFDDLILLPTRLLQHDAESRLYWQQKFKYLLIDEYQDTNNSQYLLMKLLTGDRAKFTVVGDDDQSIYSWRGANPENLTQLKQDFPSLRLIKLEQNYRSSGRILKSANHLIANNPHVFEKTLWSQHDFGAPLRVLTTKNEEDEANRVVAEILGHKAQSGSGYRDYAILYRGNHQARIIEKALTYHRIPYKLSGGTSFFSRAEIKDVLAYLRLLVNPDDDTAFLRIANVPRREIGVTTLEKLGTYANEQHISLLEASLSTELAQHLPTRSLSAVQTFAQMIVEVSDQAQRGDALDVIQAFFQQLNYQAFLMEHNDNSKAAEYKVKNVDDFLSWIYRDLGGSEFEAPMTLEQLVNKMLLRDMFDKMQEAEEADEVQMMTLHASKGLEFPHVYLIGMEEELLPHKTSIENDDIEEERRLAYVGITRAQQTLTFTMAEARKRYGEDLQCEPSRFLNELPQEDLEWPRNLQADDPATQKQKGKTRLAALRAMLNN